jgi:hypothetical protein
VESGEWGAGSGEQGKTIHNLGVNHTIKNGFGVTSFLTQNLTKRQKYAKWLKLVLWK